MRNAEGARENLPSLPHSAFAQRFERVAPVYTSAISSFVEPAITFCAASPGTSS
jgi:hypothetical protein